ncbi:MAG: hypothetical protein JXR76_32700 [Deltaproteobacteria bacterium]|nr:hypothetical protein [Deltaproteobacteria bacterium]
MSRRGDGWSSAAATAIQMRTRTGTATATATRTMELLTTWERTNGGMCDLTAAVGNTDSASATTCATDVDSDTTSSSDHGNLRSGDGGTDNCEVENGFTCRNAPVKKGGNCSQSLELDVIRWRVSHPSV